MNYLKSTDPQLYQLILQEKKRQEETLMMIASENIASRSVEEAVGSCLGNKYAEGYPNRRYYQGQEYVDQIESLAINRAKKLFSVPEVNVQPHSGSPANFAVFTALLNPGDTIMGLSLSAGGHLTHGAKMNASSIYFNSVPYELGKDGYLDYEAIHKQASIAKPKLIIAGTTAYPRLIDWSQFAKIADSVGAFLLADISHISGLIVAGAYPSPEPYAHVITTTTHKTLRGPRGAMIMTTQKGIDRDESLAKKINSAIIPGIQGGPHLNAIAGIAVALKEADSASYRSYAKQIIKNAKTLSEELLDQGFELVSGGTDSHLILIDLRNQDLLGNTVAEGLEAVNIVTNRNGVPFDTNSPFYPSGLRIGTPGITSRNMKEEEVKKIASHMSTTIKALVETKKKLGYSSVDEKKRVVRDEIIEKTSEVQKVKKQVLSLCKSFPLLNEY